MLVYVYACVCAGPEEKGDELCLCAPASLAAAGKSISDSSLLICEQKEAQSQNHLWEKALHSSC